MHLVFMFMLICFFRILRSCKVSYSHRSISPTWNVLKSFRYVKVRNRVRNWNNVKKFIFLWSKIQLCQLEILIFIYNIICPSTLINSVSFLFCEFIRVTRLNKGKTIILVRSSFQIPKIEILVSYSRSTNVNVNMSFPNSIFEGPLVLIWLESHFDIIES